MNVRILNAMLLCEVVQSNRNIVQNHTGGSQSPAIVGSLGERDGNNTAQLTAEGIETAK